MDLYIVFVRFTQPGIAGSRWSVRYIDTQWARKEHANDRKRELEHALDRANIATTDCEVKILYGKVQDAAVSEPEEEK